MLYSRFFLFAAILCIACPTPYCAAKTIHSDHYRYSLDLPGSMHEVHDSTGSADEQLYFDSTAGVVILLSGRKSNFKSVREYIDCSQAELEHDLQKNCGDTTLRLISCRRFAKYPKKTTVIHFRMSDLSNGFDTYMIYFIHHRRKDIQISFTFRNHNSEPSIAYIDRLMQTLILN